MRPTAPFDDPAAIPAPFDITVAQESGAIVLSWSAGANPYEHVDGWNVYRRTVMGGPATRLNGGLVVDIVFRDTLVVEGASYFYSLRAVSPAGIESAATHDIEFRYDSVAPATPAGLTATPGPNSVQLSWTPVTAPDLAFYRVFRDGALLAAPIPAASHLDMPVAPTLTHEYAVTAVDLRGNESPRSASVPTMALPAMDTVPPATPAGFAVEFEGGGLRLRWGTVDDPDLAGYLPYRRRAGEVDFTRPPGAGLVTATEFLDTQVEAGVAYDYAVTAVDVAGNESARSVVASATWTSPLVETGGDAIGSVYPWCGIASNSGRMQFLVPAADLDRAGRITEIGLWVRGGAAIYHNVTVTLAHTGAAELEADFVANRNAAAEAPRTVFGPATVDSEVRPAGAVLPFPFTGGFDYDGASALLVEVVWNGDDGRTAVFGFGSTAGARRRLWRQPADGGGASGWEAYQQYLRFRFE